MYQFYCITNPNKLTDDFYTVLLYTMSAAFAICEPPTKR